MLTEKLQVLSFVRSRDNLKIQYTTTYYTGDAKTGTTYPIANPGQEEEIFLPRLS
jgi:hypothetical protein